MGTKFVVVGGDAAGLSAAGKAKRDAPEFDVVVFERSDWASYGACGLPYYVHPGWSRMVVHATADSDTGRLLGANMVGEEGTAHRINSVATALDTEMTVSDVGSLDFGYAPPFGPVWDPVLGVAKVLDEKLAGAGDGARA
jgi:pyruvate/2-oxoglutarate dehydrogenase complex dihydrolipoamide dehydrogenase (E3) component